MTAKPDPVEFIVRNALAMRGVDFTEGDKNDDRLDFHLPDLGVSIECKQFFTPRISEQMQRSENVIVIQGVGAAKAFFLMMTGEDFKQ
jgi:hypothetical protein